MISNRRSGLSAAIKAEALRLGFASCGIVAAQPIEPESHYFAKWLAAGMNAQMHYMARNIEKRCNPQELLPGAQSVICLAFDYSFKQWDPQTTYKVARYACDDDYHYVLKAKLNELLQYIKNFKEEISVKIAVDSVPLLERALAWRAGLGWVGKNTNLLHKQLGSFFFLAEIICDLELEYDKPLDTEHCGTCRRCIEACPTGALTEPYILDARKCISYLTIENKEDIPSELASKCGGWVFGCDICQDVCPWNQLHQKHIALQYFELPTIDEWKNMSEKDFKIKFNRSALLRAGLQQIRKNIETQSGFIQQSSNCTP